MIPSLSKINIFVVTWKAPSKIDVVLSKFSKLDLSYVSVWVGPVKSPLIESCPDMFTSQRPVDFEGFFIVYISVRIRP